MGALYKLFCWCLPWVLAAVPCLSSAKATLRVLAWPGYAPPEIVQTFEQRTGARVEVTLVDSDQDLWNKVSSNQGQDFDVFAVNTAELQRYIRDQLVVALDPKAIPRLSTQLPRFRTPKDTPGWIRYGKTYAVPYTYAEMGLIYDRQQIQRPPTSISALWDERYRGKVIAYGGGTHNFSIAAQVEKLPTPFQISDQQWPKLVHRLIALRRNVGAFYTQPEESVQLFQRHQAALMYANFGSQQVQLLKKAGIDVGYAIPDEGALAWLDCWAMTRGATDTSLAHAWINYLLEPEPSRALVTQQGLANTISGSPFLHQGARLVWLEPLESEDRRNTLWERIVSGAKASKVLAP